jgi:hypothetical protein
MPYKSDLEAAHSRITSLEHELDSIDKSEHHCDGCKCGRKSLWARIRGKRCACGNPMYACLLFYVFSILGLAVVTTVYFLV